MADSKSDREKGMEFNDGCEANADAVVTAGADVAAATLCFLAAGASDEEVPENISMIFRWRFTDVFGAAFFSLSTRLVWLLEDVAPSVC